MDVNKCASTRQVGTQSNPPSRFRISAGLLISGLLAAPPGFGQPVLEEVIVTAQKRSESMQETPISLAVFDSGSIERLGITNVGDIQNLVPNLSIIPFGVSPTTLRIYIRGIGTVDSQITQDPPVGVYMDGVYMARNSGLAMDVADIERIEILRGPQGALYGRNTTGGAINIVSRRPSDQFEFSQLLSYGRYDELRSKTTVNAPLTRELAVKLSYQKHRRDGWIENTGVGEDFHAYDKDAWRVDLRWQPTEALTIDYAYDRSESDFGGAYYHLDEVSPTSFIPVTAQPRRVSKASLPEPYRSSDEQTSGHALTLTMDTVLGEFRSITAYRELEQDVYQSYSANPDFAVFVNDPFTLDQEQWSQEFQLVGSAHDGTIDYVTGLYYFSEEGTEDAVDRVLLFSIDTPRLIDIENTAWAVYGQGTWRPGQNSPWSFTLGGRYTKDKRKADNHVVPKVSADFSNFTPSITVNYAVDEHINLYGKIVSGYKSGGFNLRQADFSKNFDEETLLTYELGWKSELAARRVRFNGAVFYSDYDDIQIDILVPNQPDPILTVTENAGKAEIYGLETDITVLLTDSLRAVLSYAYLKNEIDKVKGDDANLYTLPNAPEHSYTITVDWDLATFRAGTLNLAVDHAWRDRFVTGARELVGIDVDSYSVTNVQLSLNGDDWIGRGHYRLALWLRNAFDEEYFSDTFGSFNGLHANRVASYGDPRTFGVDLEYRFR